MKYSYVIIDDNEQSSADLRAVMQQFPDFYFVGSANTADRGLDIILEHCPSIVFLEINPENKSSGLSVSLIAELHRYLDRIPVVIAISNTTDYAYNAIRYAVFDYLKKPLELSQVRQSLLKFQKLDQAPLRNNLTQDKVVIAINEGADEPQDELSAQSSLVENANQTAQNGLPHIEEETLPLKSQPLIICVKSYGDYRFIEGKNICYLKADNNSTDIHLVNGEMITAFKTLKHFENVLKLPFVRIHNSYIVNIDYVSRIHTGNSVCYIKDTLTKLPFSKTYKENIDAVLTSISLGNYLEI
ncbi:MAG: LytTR family transcriptional regulator DNA-binding domain-containing protein [Flavobacterium sp.]|nr:LytTR family transcriptional regulator DNA-binding domain-containing protein [Flavobacterium sp.]